MSVFDRIRIRRERITDALWDGWDRVLDGVGTRWERVTDAIRDRRERLTDALWDGWERSLGSIGARWERLRGGYRARPEERSGERAEPFRQSVAQRSSIIVGTTLCFVLIVTAVVLIDARLAPPAPPSRPSRADRGIDVPNVRGMPASDARAELERAGLTFAEPRATLGTPGLVLRTEPNIGRSVPPGTPVTIIIGVEAERLGPANS